LRLNTTWFRRLWIKCLIGWLWNNKKL